MKSFPARTEKIEPADRSHIDFVRRCADGSYRGIRVRDTECILIETDPGDVKPKTPRETGVAHALRSSSMMSAELEIEREIQGGNYPELLELLSGSRTLSDAFSPRQ